MLVGVRVTVGVEVAVLVGVWVTVAVGVAVGVGVGRHSAPELEPGICEGRTVVVTVPAPPFVAPKALAAVVVVPFAPPVTLEPAGALESRMTPPAPPPPGPW